MSSTTWEHLEGAAVSLARCGAIKDRLIEAYREHLSRVDPGQLSEALRGELQYCRDTLTRESPLRGEDAVRATVRKMSNEQAEELACGMVRLFGAALREGARAPLGEAPAELQLSEVVIGTVGSALRPKLVRNASPAIPAPIPRVIERYAAEG
ncbi:MAG: hypothetical protein JSR67_12310 [Proteobacteria bacterium]|nr:hypothetical protein [Pseudomonadota bacterium]